MLDTLNYAFGKTQRIIEQMNETSINYEVKWSEFSQSCPTLCDLMDCSPPGSSLGGILQARVLEWVAISFSRGSPDPGIKPGSPEFQADALTSEHKL